MVKYGESCQLAGGFASARQRAGRRSERKLAEDINCTIVWGHDDDALRDELVDLWLAENALPSREAALERAEEAVAVARDGEGRIVGVATMRETFAKRFANYFFLYRTFIARPRRRDHVATAMVLAVTGYLEAEFAAGRIERAVGLLAVTDNPHLQAGLRDAVTIIVPFVFVGLTDEGKQMRVYYFKGAKIA
jgi:hypothetical protein